MPRPFTVQPASPTAVPPEYTELHAFLTEANAVDAFDTCVRNRMDMEVLADCSPQDLFTMGVPFGTAKRIVNALKKSAA